MTCPQCLRDKEVAFLAMSDTLVCMGADCTWHRRLSEAEVFELFFGSQAFAVGTGEETHTLMEAFAPQA